MDSSSSVDEGLDDQEFDDDFLNGGDVEKQMQEIEKEDGGDQNGDVEMTEPTETNASSSAVNGESTKDDEGEAAVEWPLIHCVEMPGDVQNADVAIEKLGGRKNFNKSIEDDNVTLNTGNYSVPLAGDVNKTSHVLVKARRHKKTGEVTTEVVGVVNKSVKFHNMADYHYVVPEAFRQKRTIAQELENKDEVFMPPACYTKWITPYNYGFEENIFSQGKKPAKVDNSDGLDELVLRNPRWIQLKVLKFQDLLGATNSVPQGANPELVKNLNSVETEVLAILKPLFAKRPMLKKNFLKKIFG
mgnify:CR=1 FL=1